jgi:DNA-directed RNA polymerase specialized sigma subunit
MTTYTVTTRDEDRTVKDALETRQHIHREFGRTEKQAAVARRALQADEELTVGEVADELDMNVRYVVEILEYAQPVQLADMVLEVNDYDPDAVYERGDTKEMNRLYERVLPRLLDREVIDA